MQGLIFAYDSSQLCTGVNCSWECFQFWFSQQCQLYAGVHLFTLGFFLKWLSFDREKNEHADSRIHSVV